VCRVRGTTIETLPVGARVGTDSPRRVAFLRAIRPDLDLHPLHGNVDTRLAKLDRGETDALVLAVAGLTRLGRAERIDDILPVTAVPSAPGQGSLALQVRASDAEAIAAVGLLDDADTRVAVEAETALLAGPAAAAGRRSGAVGTVRDGGWRCWPAERTWTPGEGAAITVSRVAWVRGDGAPPTAPTWRRGSRRIVALRAAPGAGRARPVGGSRGDDRGAGGRGRRARARAGDRDPCGGPGGAFDTAVAQVSAGDIV
jgi:hydroxymethylbilane synthase